MCSRVSRWVRRLWCCLLGMFRVLVNVLGVVFIVISVVLVCDVGIIVVFMDWFVFICVC